MKSFSIALVLLATSIFLGRQPAKGYSANADYIDAKSIIIGFLQKVYGTQEDALKIAHQYIKLDDSPGLTNEFSIDKRYEIAAENINLLREGKGVSSFSPPLNKEELAALRVVPYVSLATTTSTKLLDFGLGSTERQYLYVALKDNIAWKYFYVKEDKIYSFDYLLKGDSSRVFLFGY